MYGENRRYQAAEGQRQVLGAILEMTKSRSTGSFVRRAALSTLLATMLGGCSSQAGLTIYSQPSGAYITEVGSGTAIGIAPAFVVYPKYSVKQHRDPDGCFRLRGIKGLWVSGASAMLDPVRICGSPGGRYQVVLARDPSAPNLEKDLQFALQVEATRAQQQQAQASADAAQIAAYTAIQASRPTKCTSTVVDDSVQTNCN